ncbi:hypothetical protein E4U15_004716, partial [Claviceps sp. LM218 group G6]
MIGDFVDARKWPEKGHFGKAGYEPETMTPGYMPRNVSLCFTCAVNKLLDQQGQQTL